MSSFVPFPPFLDRPVTPKNGKGASRSTQVKRTGNTFWHTMVGNLWSTDAWFRHRDSASLTPWGIGGRLDGPHDGTIIRFMDYEKTDFEPWSSGPWIAPGMGDGQRYVDTFGVRGINGLAEAIEFSGLVATPVSAKQWLSGIWLTAAIIHDGGRDSEEYLWNMHHREICIRSGKDCPFPRIYSHTKQYQLGIVRLLQHYEGKNVERVLRVGTHDLLLPFKQTTGSVTPPASPVYVEFEADRTFTVGNGRATVRQWGNRKATTFATFDPGKQVVCDGYYHGEPVDGKNRWLVMTNDPRGRIHESAFIEAI